MAGLLTFGYVIAALVLLGVLIMAHEAGHFFMARWCGIAVKEFSIGMGPKIWSRKSEKTGTLYSMRLLPLGGFCLYYGEDEENPDPRAYNNQAVWKRFLSILAGPAMNFVLAVGVAIVLFMTWNVLQPTEYVGSVEPDRPAAQAGLLPGDYVTAVNGVSVANPEEATALIRQNGGAPLQLDVRRAQETLSLQMLPFYDEEAKAYRVGISFAEEAKLPLGKAIGTSVTYCKDMVVMTYRSIANLVFKGEGAGDVSGPVGIINVIQQETRKGGIEVYLQLAVLISINLGFMNLLPLPALDGSKLVFCAVEAIRRKPINRTVEGTIHAVGLLALLGLMLVFTFRDIVKLF